MTPKQVLAMIKEKGAVMVDIKFIDLLGQWQHFTVPISEFKDESAFEEGLGFDGSSIRGWQSIESSDMLVIPDPDTAVMEPFTKDPTLSLICDISDPITRADYTRDPRNIARKAEQYLKSTGIADTALLRSRAGILHLRWHPLRHQPALELLLYRIERGCVEQRQRGHQPRLQAALQGRLLPGRSQRQP